MVSPKDNILIFDVAMGIVAWIPGFRKVNVKGMIENTESSYLERSYMGNKFVFN